jgi:hypothetical protein
MEVHLTLGNKKAVDIVVVRAPGHTVTIDVKAVAGKTDWLIGNADSSQRERHFVVLITYDGKFAEPSAPPRAWVLPHSEFLALVRTAKPPSTMRYIYRPDVMNLTDRAEAWKLLRAAG